ncbi:glutamate mutase L [Thermogemmatispora sp.]|uniref:glutamate mutase L n=1 Tax=Thermogemmatispora sp. TaxID=1968838 RepID=UPI0035E4347C
MQTQLNQQEGQAAAHRKDAATANSILVADCGSVLTKVSLLGLVEGQYRLMARGEAPTTLAAPQEDITQGIVQAINEIELVTGRQIVANGRLLAPEQPDGNGVDVFVTTISAGGPLRLVVLGAASPALTELVSQAVSGLYAETQALPSPSFTASMSVGQLSQPGTTPLPGVSPLPWTSERLALEWRRQLDRLRELQPHAAIIVGMADGPTGPTPIQEACQLLVNAAHEQREKTKIFPLPVLYAAAPQYVEASRRLIDGAGEVLRLDPLVSASNLGPISLAVNALYERTILRRLPGSETLWSWSSAAPVATATSLSSLVRFLAHHYTMNVMAVDAGGANTTLLLAGERGEFIPMVNAGIGVGSGLGELLKRVGSQHISRWLPFDVSDEELRQFVLNTMLHPHVVPSSQRELQISQAFAREAILLTAEALKTGAGALNDFSPDLILATGSVLAHAPRPAQAALMLLDALQPRGVTSLVLDRTLLFQQLGAIATVNPVAAVQVNENDAVTHRLGTCVIPYGALPPDQIALRVVLEYSNGRQVQVEVMSGSIEVVPLRLNEQALLTLYPAPSVDVGLGPGERARAAEEIDGGLVGLIIDARGRPLVLPADKAERQARLLQWSQAIGA